MKMKYTTKTSKKGLSNYTKLINAFRHELLARNNVPINMMAYVHEE